MNLDLSDLEMNTVESKVVAAYKTGYTDGYADGVTAVQNTFVGTGD